MKPFVLYTLARLGLFVVAAVVVWLVLGLPSLGQENVLWILLIALIVSSVASIWLLAELRGQFSAAVTARAENLSARVEQARRREDELD